MRLKVKRVQMFVSLCDQLCSVEHLLTKCVNLMDWRRQFLNTESLKVLFSGLNRSALKTNLFHKQ